MAATTAPLPPRPAGPPLARLAVIVRYTALLLLTALFVAPLVYMAVTSFKTQADAIASTPQWIPHHPTTDGYRAVQDASNGQILRWFANSVIGAAAQALLIVVTASLAAYPLARMRFAGQRIVFAVVVSTLFVPSVILIVPNYVIVSQLNWLDSLPAIIIPGAAGAFGVFYMRQFFLGLPVELEEAAALDGAGRLRTFLQIVLPLAKPSLVTLALLAFLTNWNDFLWPLYVLFSSDHQTLPAGLATLQNANTVRYDILMAGAMIAAVPVLALYTFAQRYIVEGVSRSGLKG
ncbi:carbohydrate ABC transporter permease [Kitasatospora sp. NPDC001603]|uniref:carbohydrate ABC transporter permease n=1 Tax=Kitasatospora sp. NPDC001603 TaxID=3154388 RepID=UPI003322B3F9